MAFSLEPITKKYETRSELKNSASRQTLVSLCILEKLDGVWQIHEQARLPKIAHGQTADSVAVHDFTADNLHVIEEDSIVDINAKGDIILKAGDGDRGPSGTISAEAINAKAFMQNNKPLPVIDLKKSIDANSNDCWQLRITGVSFID